MGAANGLLSRFPRRLAARLSLRLDSVFFVVILSARSSTAAGGLASRLLLAALPAGFLGRLLGLGMGALGLGSLALARRFPAGLLGVLRRLLTGLLAGLLGRLLLVGEDRGVSLLFGR